MSNKIHTYRPELIQPMMLHDIHVIACGESHVAMLTKEGKIFVCGAGENGRLGTGNEDDRYGDNTLCTTCKCLINTCTKYAISSHIG